MMELLGDVGHVESRFGPFLDGVSVGANWCTVCAKCTTGSEIIWTHVMELLGDVGHVESRFGPFGDGVSVGVRLVHCLRQTYHKLRNHLEAHDGTAR
jgi:hypothetical protein